MGQLHLTTLFRSGREMQLEKARGGHSHHPGGGKPPPPSPGTLRLGSPVSLPLGTPPDTSFVPPPLWPRPSMPTSSPLPSRAESCGGNQVIPPPSPVHSPTTSLALFSSTWASDRPLSLYVRTMPRTWSLACCMACTSCLLFFAGLSSSPPYQTTPPVP